MDSKVNSSLVVSREYSSQSLGDSYIKVVSEMTDSGATWMVIMAIRMKVQQKKDVEELRQSVAEIKLMVKDLVMSVNYTSRPMPGCEFPQSMLACDFCQQAPDCDFHQICMILIQEFRNMISHELHQITS